MNYRSTHFVIDILGGSIFVKHLIYDRRVNVVRGERESVRAILNVKRQLLHHTMME